MKLNQMTILLQEIALLWDFALEAYLLWRKSIGSTQYF